jgi:hypothetical protein
VQTPHFKHKIIENSSVSIVTIVRYCPKTIPFPFDERSLLFLIMPRQALGLIQPFSTDELLSLEVGGGRDAC